MDKMISIQEHDFTVQTEYDAMCEKNANDGAVVFFVGRVRDVNVGDSVSSMTLEHYPGMTENVLNQIIDEARTRWPLNRVRVIHRIGQLEPEDQIVFVAVSSPHRDAAFLGAQFIMDYLKTKAPFWKKEQTPGGSRWVDAKQDDDDKVESWSES